MFGVSSRAGCRQQGVLLGGFMEMLTFAPPSTLMTYAVVSREPLYTRLSSKLSGLRVACITIHISRFYVENRSGNIHRELSINSKGQAEVPYHQDQQFIFQCKRTTTEEQRVFHEGMFHTIVPS